MSISGKYIVAKIDGVIVQGVQSWDADETVDQLDGTTGTDEGYENDDTGIGRVVVSMDLVQDITTGVYAVVRAGTLITNLQLFRDKDDLAPAFLIPSFQVYQSTSRGEVRGRLTVRVVGRSRGTYTANDPA